MMPAPIPDDDAGRLQALKRYDTPDGIPQEAFGRILQLATDVLNLPSAAINFVGESMHLGRASLGAPMLNMPRSESFCAWAITSPDVMVVPDLQSDSRFQDHPLVQPQEGLRSYAGAPITTPDGQQIGTLCVADNQVHDLSTRERSILKSLARLVMDELELRLRERELEAAANYARVLMGVSALGERELSAEQMAGDVAVLLGQVVDLDWMAVVELRSGVLTLLSDWHSGRLNAVPEARLREGMRPDGGMIADSLRRQSHLFVDHYADWPGALQSLAEAGLGGVACLYLTDSGGAPQLLLALRQRQDAWTEAEQQLFRASARSLRVSLERQQRMREMQRAAYTDALTQLRNRRAFDEDVHALDAGGRPYAVAMIDLDGMKAINDRLGHAEGDLLLQTFARHLIRGLHDADQAYRLGGDEFAVLLSDPPPSAETLSRILSERLERSVLWTRASGFPDMNASLGWASAPGEAGNGEVALELADRRMYEQKGSRGGRGAAADSQSR